MRTLFHHTICPYSRKVRIFLHEKKIDFELKEENFWIKSDNLRNINALGCVPVFQELNGFYIADSLAICEYIEEVYTQNPLYSKDNFARAEARKISIWFDTRFANEVSLVLVWEKFFKRLVNKDNGNSYPDSQKIRQAKYNLVHYLNYTESLLENRNWLASNELSVADITVAAHFSILDYFGDINWDNLTNTKNWFMKLKSRPSYQKILKDRLSSIPPSENYCNLDF